MGEILEQDIFQLIDRSNFKACNAKINDWKKKNPNSTYLWVLETYVKYRQSPSKFNYDLDLGKFFGLQGTQITSDLKALRLLHDMFFEMSRYDEALHVYERACFKYPSFEVAYDWFCKALDDSNYKMMARACQQMAKWSANDDMGQNIFPRDYTFWYSICIIALFKFQRSKISVAEEKLLPQLAFRSLESQKPFKSTQEVIVYCNVCQELFKGSKSGEIVEEIWPQLDQSLDLYYKNFLIKHINDDKQMLEACSSMLTRIDDYELLSKLIEATYNLGWDKALIIKLVNSLVGDSRNSRLCQLEIDLKFDNEIGSKSLTYYLSKYHNRPCCPQDLSRFKNHLGDLEEIFCSFQPHDEIHDSNAFNLGLLSSVDDAIGIIQNHQLKLQDKPKTDYSTISNLIMKLIHDLIIEKEPTLENVLLALSILENYQNVCDPYNYRTAVWTVALYMHLGLVPVAYSRYLDLKIKNLQNDTANFILYSRYATLFPQKEHDYLRKFQNENYRLYSISGRRLPQFIHIAMENRAYSKLLGMFEFGDRLVRSSMKWMNLLEEFQLARLCNTKKYPLWTQLTRCLRELDLTGDNKEFSDNRDWRILGDNVNPNALPQILDYLDINQDYISLKIVLEWMIELIPSSKQDSKMDEFLSKVLNGRDLEAVFNEAKLDAIEIWTFNIFYDLYRANGARLNGLLSHDIPVIPSFSWRLTHNYLTKLATLKTLDRCKRIKDVKIKQLVKCRIRELREEGNGLYKEYAEQLKTACEDLKNGPNRELLERLGYEPLTPAALYLPLLALQNPVLNL